MAKDARTVVEENLYLVVTGVLLLCFILKLRAVAHQDVTTATTLLRQVGPGDIAFGVLVVALPPTLSVAGLAVFAWLFRKPGKGFYVAAGVNVLLVLLVWDRESATVWATFGILAIALRLCRGKGRRRMPGFISKPVWWATWLFMALIFLSNVIYYIGRDTPWLPPQILEQEGGTSSTVYVLDEDATTMTLLIHSPRGIAVVEKGSVKSLHPCDDEDDEEFPRPIMAASWDARTGKYPDCP